MVRNVHERLIPRPAAELEAALDTLGTPEDRLWPAPPWPPMRLRAGRGGHGPIRYSVTERAPGRLAFAFEPTMPIRGGHVVTVEPRGDGSLVRHELSGTLRGIGWLVWPLAIRLLHDALLEDLLDRAEGRRRNRWSPWVRLLTRGLFRARAVPVPDTALLRAALPRVDASDAYAVPATDHDPQVWADAVFRDPPAWVVALLGLRQAVVGLVGIRRADRSAFATVARTDDEVLLGTDDTHLDFRASVLREDRRVVLTTVVHVHSGRGRLYWGVVRHVHPVVVKAMLARAARRLAAAREPRRL
jgi:hypothetical protein